ncbi:hypothetical protein M758_6G032900 [Ceratodon purpureus]|nr:hypothetical protein M758_6G032900 [Ceratodon purpureus]
MLCCNDTNRSRRTVIKVLKSFPPADNLRDPNFIATAAGNTTESELLTNSTPNPKLISIINSKTITSPLSPPSLNSASSSSSDFGLPLECKPETVLAVACKLDSLTS